MKGIWEEKLYLWHDIPLLKAVAAQFAACLKMKINNKGRRNELAQLKKKKRLKLHF